MADRPRKHAAPPARRPPPDPATSRALAVAGVVGLFIVLILIVTMISGGGGDDEQTAAAPTATATPTPRPTRTPEPTPTVVPLTPDEKLNRQDDIDVVRSRGFDVVDKRDWKPDDTLQVLIGRTSSGAELAFFFVDGQYLGNDSTDTSGKLRLRGTDDLSVTLRYGIYEPGDDPAKPSGEPVDVEFRYEGGRVVPGSAIPDVSQRNPSG